MYAITGITGKVGGEIARHLIGQGESVRAVLRNRAKAADWAAMGCDIAITDMANAEQLAAAFSGVEGVFILPPSDFDPAPGYPEAKRVIESVSRALTTARSPRIVCLSTIGADAPHDNLLTQRTLMERSLNAISLPVAFLRPGWFMENALWDVASARDEGVLRSFLQPADKAFPMVATKDVSRLAANLIRQDSSETRIVELEGPVRISANELARAFGAVLGRPARVKIVPRENWDGLFRAQGMTNPLPRMRMLDGFNEGWIEFQDHGRSAVKGNTPLVEVITALVAGSKAA
jgi:uncharacterized protein YbjT (DUF2867 family)